MFDLHACIFWICVFIVVGVFGVMLYSIFRHRKSLGRDARPFHENALVELIWTVIPFLILLFMAYPATRTILAMKDASAPGIAVKVTGYQWKLSYGYLQEGFGFCSGLMTPLAQIGIRKPKGERDPLAVGRPMAAPVTGALRMADGIDNVDVSLERATAPVACDETAVRAAAIVAALEAEGFGPPAA